MRDGKLRRFAGRVGGYQQTVEKPVEQVQSLLAMHSACSERLEVLRRSNPSGDTPLIRTLEQVQAKLDAEIAELGEASEG